MANNRNRAGRALALVEQARALALVEQARAQVRALRRRVQVLQLLVALLLVLQAVQLTS